MPRKKDVKDDKDTSNKNVGRPSGNNGLEDTHPRLQLNFFRTQVMVYDTTIVPARNEIEFMLGNCQRSIDDGDNTWAFMLRKLAFVFIIMALDKLKSRSDDLTVKAQCKAMVPEFEGATSTLYLKEDMSSILLNHFTGGQQLSSQFHDYVNSLRDRTPVNAQMTWVQSSFEVRTLQSSAMSESVFRSLVIEHGQDHHR